jgi:phosphonoacetate hydrolase
MPFVSDPGGQVITLNGRTYRVPHGPVVAVCLDGCGPAYLDDALEHAAVPALRRFRESGFMAITRGAMPSFTNPNNVSIVTGVPPSVHGICGNFFFDEATAAEVMMDSADHLRCKTLLRALADAGKRVLAVTAKHKLLSLLSPGPRGTAFSFERPGEGGERLSRRPSTEVYSAEASLWVLDVGVAALERGLSDVVYLSTTDYVQHMHAEGSAEARAFFEAIDTRLSRLDALGAVVGITADHGMNDKTRAGGSPNVVYLQPLLDSAVGAGTRVLLPITDPYVVHHGALGSFALVYLRGKDENAARTALEGQAGVEDVVSRREAAARFELPADRIGDLVVLGARDAVLGKSEGAHDLSHVRLGLRSHGGLHEQRVPLLLNRHVAEGALSPETLRNFDLFDLMLNAARANGSDAAVTPRGTGP